jgi:hypothetical protein
VKKIFALIKGPMREEKKDRILLFENEKDRDAALDKIIKDAKADYYSVHGEYSNYQTYQFEYHGPGWFNKYERVFTWTKVELELKEGDKNEADSE